MSVEECTENPPVSPRAKWLRAIIHDMEHPPQGEKLLARLAEPIEAAEQRVSEYCMAYVLGLMGGGE